MSSSSLCIREPKEMREGETNRLWYVYRMSAARKKKRPPDKIYDRPVSTLPNLVVTFRSTMFLFALSTRSGIRHIWRRKKEKQLLLKLLRCNMNVVVLDSTAWLQLSGTILVDSQLHVTTRSKKNTIQQRQNLLVLNLKIKKHQRKSDSLPILCRSRLKAPSPRPRGLWIVKMSFRLHKLWRRAFLKLFPFNS